MGFLYTSKLYLHSIFKHKAVLGCIIFVQMATIFCCLYMFSSTYCTYLYSSNICGFYLECSNPTILSDVLDASINLAEIDNYIIVKIYLDKEHTIYINLNNNKYATVGTELNNNLAENQAFLSYSENYNLGDTVIILNEEYTVIGLGNLSGMGINYSTCDLSTPVCGIEIYDYTIKSASTQSTRIDYIVANYDIMPVYTQSPSFLSYLVNNLSSTAQLLSIMIIASLGFTLGLQYLIAENKATIKVLRICGMKAYSAQLILLCLGLAITMGSCILGSCVYAIYFNCYVKNSGAYVSDLTFLNYVAINMFMFILPIISALTIFENKAIRSDL